jgi:hypothetical protein
LPAKYMPAQIAVLSAITGASIAAFRRTGCGGSAASAGEVAEGSGAADAAGEAGTAASAGEVAEETGASAVFVEVAEGAGAAEAGGVHGPGEVDVAKGSDFGGPDDEAKGADFGGPDDVAKGSDFEGPEAAGEVDEAKGSGCEGPDAADRLARGTNGCATAADGAATARAATRAARRGVVRVRMGVRPRLSRERGARERGVTDEVRARRRSRASRRASDAWVATFCVRRRAGPTRVRPLEVSHGPAPAPASWRRACAHARAREKVTRPGAARALPSGPSTPPRARGP